jgi:hypothetical protein
MLRSRLVAVVAVSCCGLGVGFVAGCGGSNDAHDKSVANAAAQQALNQERQRQEDEAQRQKLRKLTAKLHRERRKKNAQQSAGSAAGNGGGSSGSGDSSGSGGSSGGGGSGSSCGSGVTAGPHTTCSFALNVAEAYRRSGGASSIQVYSPVTKRTYTMNCSGSSTTTCTGGNNASVTFS